MVTGLLFGAKHDDFDFIISTDDNGFTTVNECYPNAFINVFRDKSCSVYVVEEEGFQQGLTSWDEELVCDTEVAVQDEIKIGDLYERLIEEAQGNLKISKYEFNNDYRKKISSHIVDRLFRFNIDLKNCLDWGDSRFCAYYREIIEGLLTIMDGHLLQ